MKARLLKSLLNNTGYLVHYSGNKVCIGSGYISELITVDGTTLNLRCSLIPNNRSALRHDELEFIWDKLEELIKNGKMRDIINGNDPTDDMIPVYSVDEGELIEEYTDKIEWPNITHTGKLIYQNTHFTNKKDALKNGIKNHNLHIEYINECINNTKKDLERLELNKVRTIDQLQTFKILLNYLE